MSKSGISNPAIIINNLPFAIVPNSYKANEGQPEVNTRTQSTGGGNFEKVDSVNAETAFSEGSFEVYPIADAIERVRQIRANGSANVMTATAPGFTRTYQSFSITNKYDINASQDGTIALEWSSDPAI